jgi:hypothetical protein
MDSTITNAGLLTHAKTLSQYLIEKINLVY